MRRPLSPRHRPHRPGLLWVAACAIVAVGLERLAWLAFRTLTPARVHVDHFVAAHEPAFRLGISLLVIATPLFLLAIALATGTSRRAAIGAGLLVTLPEWVIAFALEARVFQDRFRTVWYRMMDFETAALYPADLLQSALRGEGALAPSSHWLTEAGTSPWLPIDLYFAVLASAVFWFILFSMLASSPKRAPRPREVAMPLSPGDS